MCDVAQRDTEWRGWKRSQVWMATRQQSFPFCPAGSFAVRRGGEHGGSEDWEQDGEGTAVPLGHGAG